MTCSGRSGAHVVRKCRASGQLAWSRCHEDQPRSTVPHCQPGGGMHNQRQQSGRGHAAMDGRATNRRPLDRALRPMMLGKQRELRKRRDRRGNSTLRGIGLSFARLRLPATMTARAAAIRMISPSVSVSISPIMPLAFTGSIGARACYPFATPTGWDDVG